MDQAVADLVAAAVLGDAEANHLTKVRRVQKSRASLGFFVPNHPDQVVRLKQFD